MEVQAAALPDAYQYYVRGRGYLLDYANPDNLKSAVALFSINALFVVFVVIQFAALFGGEEFLRSQGLTYSEYARRGFFELLAVSLITMGPTFGYAFAEPGVFCSIATKL